MPYTMAEECHHLASNDSEPLTSVEFQAVTTVGAVISSFSLIGSGLIIIAYLLRYYDPERYKELGKLTFRLVFYMAFSNFWVSVSDTFGFFGDLKVQTTLCLIQALMNSFFYAATVIWCILIAFTFHMVFLNDYDRFSPRNLEKIMNIYYVIGWGIPFVMMLAPLSTVSYGPSGGMCWICNGGPGTYSFLWRILQFYMWVWGGIVYCSYVTIRVFSIKNPIKDAEAREIKYYPLILILTLLFPSIHRIHDAVSGGHELFWLNIAHWSTSSLFGVMIAIVFFWTPTVKKILFNSAQNKSKYELLEDHNKNEYTRMTKETHLPEL